MLPDVHNLVLGFINGLVEADPSRGLYYHETSLIKLILWRSPFEPLDGELELEDLAWIDLELKEVFRAGVGMFGDPAVLLSKIAELKSRLTLVEKWAIENIESDLETSLVSVLSETFSKDEQRLMAFRLPLLKVVLLLCLTARTRTRPLATGVQPPRLQLAQGSSHRRPKPAPLLAASNCGHLRLVEPA